MLDKGYNALEIRLILGTLRPWSDGRIPVVISGSIGVRSFLEDVGLDSRPINHMIPIDLPPPSRKEARSLLDDLVAGAKLQSWTPETTEKVLDRLDDLFPFFIQCAFLHLSAEDNADEEQRNVKQPSLLLSEIKRKLAERPASSVIPTWADEEADEWEAARESLVTSIRERVGGQHPLIVVAVENFDILLDKVFKSDEARSRLRRFLAECPNLMLIEADAAGGRRAQRRGIRKRGDRLGRCGSSRNRQGSQRSQHLRPRAGSGRRGRRREGTRLGRGLSGLRAVPRERSASMR